MPKRARCYDDHRRNSCRRIEECGVQRESAGEKHQIYEVCGCLCKWNRRKKSFSELPIKTREVVGFDKEDVFKKMDAIANAVSDSCEPAIIPDITLQTVDGKTIIVVEISEGRQRPYYIKALGRDGGVYVRVAGTTRLADEYMIKELLFEGSNRYYDQALCNGLNITDEDIDVLCKAMKEQAIKMHVQRSRKNLSRALVDNNSVLGEF